MTSPSKTSISGERPQVLLLATERWLTTARLALALHAEGCDVHLMALGGHPALLTGAVSAHYDYRPLNPIASVAAAIAQAKPETLVPVDELAVMHLIELKESETIEDLDALIARSLGSADVFAAAVSRMALLEMAQAASVKVPETVPIYSQDELQAASAQLGFPLVLKADSTAGGRGVRIVNNLDEAHARWSRLHRPVSFLSAMRSCLKWKDWTHFRPWFKRRMRGVSAQKYQRGGERTSMAVAHHGELKAYVCFEVAQASKFLGPSTVLKVIDDPAMEAAMRAILRRLGATGFCGFDFMLSEAGEPLLIEMNSRPTQLAHLALGPGRDLVAAYVRAVLGRDVSDRVAATAGSLIALYPQELVRDPQSRVLAEAHHDVPWESPALVRYALEPLPDVITGDPRWRDCRRCS